MKTISYSIEGKLKALTLTKESLTRPVVIGRQDEFFSCKKGKPFIIWANDDVPLVYCVPSLGKVGGFTISKDESLNEKAFSLIGDFIKKENVDPSLIFAYIGPSLTFSHCPITKEEAASYLAKGYGPALKGNNTATFFFDPQMMNVLQLRKLGIPFEQITISPYDTYECEPILYSALRGDKEKNPTIVELLK